MAVTANTLTQDSQVIALLCTRLALPRGDSKPLNAAEWTSLAAAVHHSQLKRPGELLGRSAAELESALNISLSAAERLVALLGRGGQLAFELERLSSRGIWVMTRADDDYPVLYKERLRRMAPAVLFGAGVREVATRRAAAVIGSRDADSGSLDFAAALSRRLAADEIAVVSGAARGVDSTAMLACVDGGGVAIGIVADALDKAIRRQDLRAHIADGVVVLLSSYHPEARFTVANAMARNRLIYCLAEAAFVVASNAKGGTREGALENLRARWTPLFVRKDSGAVGNAELLRAGAAPITRSDLEEPGLVVRLAAEPSLQQLTVAVEDANVEIAGRRPMTEAGAGSRAVDEPAGTSSADASRETVGNEQLEAFDLVWPVLADYLRMPRTEREVADRLRLETSQARSWLKRAVEEGRIERRGRPYRYQLTGDSPGQLFDRDLAKSSRAAT